MFTKIKKQSEGFTIIEVLIVLAIAGLIMLIVFLAVPALQRNSRNTGRNADASLIAAAVNECITAHNGIIAQCQTASATTVNIDVTKLNQLTTAPTYNAAAVATGNVSQATWQFGLACNTTTGVGTQAGTPRQFVVQWRQESNTADVTRCLSS